MLQVFCCKVPCCNIIKKNVYITRATAAVTGAAASRIDDIREMRRSFAEMVRLLREFRAYGPPVHPDFVKTTPLDTDHFTPGGGASRPSGDGA